MIGAIEYVKKTEVNKVQRGLIPAGIETNQAGIAVEFERPDLAAGRNEAKNGDDAQPQAPKAWLNGETRTLRLYRGVEQHVQQRLVPSYVRGIRQRRASDVGEGTFIRAEGEVRWQRDARGDHLRIRKKRVVFINLEETRNPQPGRAGKQRVGALDIEIAGATLGKHDIAHGFKRHSHEQMKMLTLGLDEHLHGHVVGNVVRTCAKRPRQEKDKRGEQ